LCGGIREDIEMILDKEPPGGLPLRGALAKLTKWELIVGAGGLLCWRAPGWFGDDIRVSDGYLTPSAVASWEGAYGAAPLQPRNRPRLADRYPSFFSVATPRNLRKGLRDARSGFRHCLAEGSLVAFAHHDGIPPSGPRRLVARDRWNLIDLREVSAKDWYASRIVGGGLALYDVRIHDREDLERWSRGVDLGFAVRVLAPDLCETEDALERHTTGDGGLEGLPDDEDLRDLDLSGERRDAFWQGMEDWQLGLRFESPINGGWCTPTDDELASLRTGEMDVDHSWVYHPDYGWVGVGIFLKRSPAGVAETVADVNRSAGAATSHKWWEDLFARMCNVAVSYTWERFERREDILEVFYWDARGWLISEVEVRRVPEDRLRAVLESLLAFTRLGSDPAKAPMPSVVAGGIDHVPSKKGTPGGRPKNGKPFERLAWRAYFLKMCLEGEWMEGALRKQKKKIAVEIQNWWASATGDRRDRVGDIEKLITEGWRALNAEPVDLFHKEDAWTERDEEELSPAAGRERAQQRAAREALLAPPQD
jgi:hypothetical protein